MRRKLIAAVAVLATGLLLAACSNGGPQDTWDPAGPVAQQQKDLLVPVLLDRRGRLRVRRGRASS